MIAHLQSDSASQPWLSPTWRYQLPLPPAFATTPSDVEAPGRAAQCLASYEAADAPVLVKVYGMDLRREVELADLLDVSPVAAGELLQRNAGVRRADCVIRRVHRAGPRLRQCALRQSGSRLFFVTCEHPERDQSNRVAERVSEVKAAVAAFAPVAPARRPYAEPLRMVTALRPRHWTAHLPSSWALDNGSPRTGATIIDARNQRHDEGGFRVVVGRLVAALIARPTDDAPRAIADLFLDRLAGQGIEVADELLHDEGAWPPFSRSWRMEGRGRHGRETFELSCRVMRGDGLWWLAGMVGASRDRDHQAWMENRRALNIISRSMRMSP